MLFEYTVKKPLNREPPVQDLIKTFITQSDVAYDRNHSPLPHIDADGHRVRVDGAVENVLELSIHALRAEFAQHEVIAALQCAGNRRHTMRTEMKEVDGIDWNDGAVCNCAWGGPLLADVLDRAGVTLQDRENAHVEFGCHITECQDDAYYGSSVCLARCLDRSKKAIIALEMNGQPLNVNHGAPVRVVMPGIAGARWIKWLDRITVQDHECQNYYMQEDYKILPPEVCSRAQAKPYWRRMPALQQMPVNSIIASPQSGCVITRTRELEVSGYALPQGDDGPVANVQVSADEGASWLDADLVYPTRQEAERDAEKFMWAWAIWKVCLPKDVVRRFSEKTRIWSRAVDRRGNVQCGQVKWNFRGVGYNGYGEAKRLRIADDCDEEKGQSRENGVGVQEDGALAEKARALRIAGVGNGSVRVDMNA